MSTENRDNDSQANFPAPHMGELECAVDRRDNALSAAYQALDDIWAILSVDDPVARGLREFISQTSWYGKEFTSRDREILRKRIDQAVWLDLVRNTKMGMTLNARQLEDIEKEIIHTTPAVEKGRVIDTFLSLFDRRNETFTEGLIDVFKRLASKYQCHSAFKINKKLIMANALQDNCWCMYKKEIFDDFYKYLLTLEGIDPTSVSYEAMPSFVIEQQRRVEPCFTIKFEYFEVKGFINGNIHINMNKRLDLIDKVNDLIEKHYKGELPKD